MTRCADAETVHMASADGRAAARDERVRGWSAVPDPAHQPVTYSKSPDGDTT